MTANIAPNHQKAILTFNVFFREDTTTQSFLPSIVSKDPNNWAFFRSVLAGQKDCKLTIVDKSIDDLLADNPTLTTADINRILYRQFGTRIHRGTVSWNGETIQLRPEVTEQLRRNYLASRGIHPSAHTATNRNPLPSQGDNRGNDIKVQSPASAGATDTNREWELNGSMDLSVYDEAAQIRKWRR